MSSGEVNNPSEYITQLPQQHDARTNL